MIIDIETLDRHLSFLQREQVYLRGQGAAWAHRKADQLGQIAELLRKVRQDQQMTGPSGRRIE